MYNPAIRTYPQPAEVGLTWSEYLYLIPVALAAFFVVDPLGFGIEQIAEIKHIPLLLTFPIFVLTLSGRRLSHLSVEPILSRVVAAAWPFAVLAAFIIIGSMYARTFEGIKETLLNYGLYMLLMFVAAGMVLASKAPEKLIRNYFKILFVAALAIAVLLIVNWRVKQVYHEEIFLVIPLAIYCALVLKNPWLRIGGLVFFLAIALFSQKNTGYLIALLTFLYLGYGFWLPRLKRTNPLNRFSGYYLIFVLLLLVAAGVMFLLAFREAYLPSGNPEYRLHAYTIAWNRFLDSPLWGTAFSESAVEKFTLYDIPSAGGVLPTHSDILDLLAHGGAIAVGLWLLGLFMVARSGNRTLLTPSTYEHPWTPYAHTLAVISLAALIVYAFNPILAKTGMSYHLWTSLGLLLGLSMRPESVHAPEVPPRRPLGRYELKRHIGEVT